MGKVFSRDKNGPSGSDCTAPYKIILHGKPTVGEFMVQVLENRNEWGTIRIMTENGKGKSAGYKYGSTDTRSIAKFMGMEIKKASAHGGWMNMDYTLWV